MYLLLSAGNRTRASTGGVVEERSAWYLLLVLGPVCGVVHTCGTLSTYIISVFGQAVRLERLKRAVNRD